jgi:hypothetical protein
VEAEERGESAPAAAPPAENAGAQAPQSPCQPAPPPVPYQRFAEVWRDANAAKERATYLEGAVEVLTRQLAGHNPVNGAPAVGTEQPAAESPPDPANTIRVQRAAILALAGRYDAAELSLAEYEEARAVHEDQILAAQREMLAAVPAAQAAPANVGLADQKILNEHLNQLYSAHLYAQALTNPQAEFLANIVRQEAEARGHPMGTGPRDTMLLRQEVARLSDFYGPRWGMQPQRAAPQSSPQSAPAPGSRPLSPVAQARQAKHAMAAGLPPDPASFGSAGSANPISEASIVGMSDEEIMRLPAQTRARLLGM